MTVQELPINSGLFEQIQCVIRSLELSFSYEKLDFPAKLNYSNLMGTALIKHKSNHNCAWI